MGVSYRTQFYVVLNFLKLKRLEYHALLRLICLDLEIKETRQLAFLLPSQANNSLTARKYSSATQPFHFWIIPSIAATFVKVKIWYKAMELPATHVDLFAIMTYDKYVRHICFVFFILNTCGWELSFPPLWPKWNATFFFFNTCQERIHVHSAEHKLTIV